MKAPTTDPRITTKFDFAFGNVVHVDGKPLTVCGQGWSQWVTLQKGSFILRTTNDSGSHTLDARKEITSAERLLAHWKGFVANQQNPDFSGAVFS
jgi:hypothetical protein